MTIIYNRLTGIRIEVTVGHASILIEENRLSLNSETEFVLENPRRGANISTEEFNRVIETSAVINIREVPDEVYEEAPLQDLNLHNSSYNTYGVFKTLKKTIESHNMNFSKAIKKLVNDYYTFEKEATANNILALYIPREGTTTLHLTNKESYSFGIRKEGNKFITSKVVNNRNVFSEPPLLNIERLCFVKIKDTIESAKIFGYGTLKKNMLVSGECFSINNILPSFKCVKDGEVRDIVEVINQGKNFKFVLSDLEFIYPDYKALLKGYTPPKDRKIKNNTDVLLKDNKHIALPRNTKVRVLAINKINSGNSRTAPREYCKVVHNNKEYFILKNKLKVI